MRGALPVLTCLSSCHFRTAGQLADAAGKNIWDIGNIAFEVDRAHIDFSDPYVLIEANFLVRDSANFHTNSDIDRRGISIGVSERSAYDLWLRNNFKLARIVGSINPNVSRLIFENKVDVLASLKPKLLEETKNNEGIRLITNLSLQSNVNRLAKRKARLCCFRK